MRRSSMLRLGDRVINFAHLITAKKKADGEGDLLDVHLLGHVLHLDGPDVMPVWDFMRHLVVMPLPAQAHHIEVLREQVAQAEADVAKAAPAQVFDLARLLVARRRPDPAPGSGYEVELTFVGGAHAETVRGENATRIWEVLRDLATAPPSTKEER